MATAFALICCTAQCHVSDDIGVAIGVYVSVGIRITVSVDVG